MPQLSVSGMGPRGRLILDFKQQETETWTNCTLDAFKQHFQTLAFGSGVKCFWFIYCNTFPVVWMFLVVSSQFLCEFPAVFVDFKPFWTDPPGATWSRTAGTCPEPWTGTATRWSIGPRAADMWRCSMARCASHQLGRCLTRNDLN